MSCTRPTLLLLVAAFWSLSLQSPAWSQPDPRQLLESARETAAQARERYDIDTPDQPLWRDTLQLAERAASLAAEDLEIQRFLALTYSEVNWHVRAFGEWLEYLEAGGDLDPHPQEEGLTAAEAFAEAGNQLGFARYQAGNLAAALGYYQQVLTHLPGDPESLYWSGRIHLEQDELEAARSYFERLLAERPDHATAGYYLTLIEEREQVGEEASRAYREGLSAYEDGRLQEAFESFTVALDAYPQFADAAVWAGRTALESGQAVLAVDYWRRAVELRPQDAAASYFLEVARTQVQWGVAAGRAFYEGQAAYQSGELELALAAFARAVEANEEMVDAWAWAARSAQALGRAQTAIDYWQGVLARRPAEDGARFALEIARHQLQYGQEAGRAFGEGVRYYQLAQFDAAEQSFRTAVQANPTFASAWGWLGRLYFTRAQYSLAAEAYSRAAELEPGNDDYAFFAQEALLLADEDR